MSEQEIKNEIEGNKKNSRKKHKILIILLTAIVALSIGSYYFNKAISYVSTDDAFVEGHSIQIAPKVSGIVSKVYIEDNQQIKKGQLLAEIDSADYQVKYEQALAKLQAAVEKQKSTSVNVNLTSITSESNASQASSAVDIAQNSIKVSEKQIAQNKAIIAQVNSDIDAIKAEESLSQLDFDRYQKLNKKGVVSKQDFDKASTNYKTIKAKLNAGFEKLTAAEAALQSAYANKENAMKSLDQALSKSKSANTVNEQVSISNAQNKMAIAEIKQLQAALKQAKLELSYTKIYAPQSGAITRKSIEEGAYIQTGQPLLLIIPEKRWIIANFKETQLTDMKVGQSVEIKIDAYPHKNFKGRIDSIQASTGSKTSLFPPENAVGSFVKVVQRVPVKIVFAENINTQYAIVPGMSVIPEVKVK